VESLLEVVGSVVQTDDDKFHVQIGEEEQVFVRPRHKDLDTQQIVDLRRMLTNAGYAAWSKRRRRRQRGLTLRLTQMVRARASNAERDS